MSRTVGLSFVLGATLTAAASITSSAFPDIPSVKPTPIAAVDKDGRMIEEEYARFKNVPLREIQDRFAASGVLSCSHFEGSAQLAGDNVTLVTSAHVLLDLKNCKPRNKAGSCEFIVRNSKGEQIIPIATTVESGFACPQPRLISEDWAVLKLKAPIVGVKPYLLPKSFEIVDRKENVVAVNSINMDLKLERKKTIEECQGGSITAGEFGVGSFDSACAAPHGASGGATLKAYGKGDVLVGITHGGETENEKKVGKKGEGFVKPPVQGQWESFHTAVAGKLLKTLRATTGQPEE